MARKTRTIRIDAPLSIAEADAAGRRPASRFEVAIIRAGRSANGNEYPSSTLRRAVLAFEGAAVYAVADAEHVSRSPYRDASRTIGRLVNVHWMDDPGELRAELETAHPEGELAQWLASALARDMRDLVGLSIAAEVVGERRRGGLLVHDITKVHAVDLVANPAAGGRIISVIEGRVMPDEEKEAARKAQIAEARVLIAESRLPKKSRKRLVKIVKNSVDVSEAAVSELIADERTALRDRTAGAPVSGLGNGDTRIVEGREHKIPAMLDAFWDPENRDVVSFKEAYINLTGDKRVTGQLKHCDRRLVAEAISIGTGSGAGVFAELFGDSLTRRTQKMYAEMDIWDWHRKVCTEVGVMDFREQKRVIWGGYGDLPTVAQGGAYTDITSPTDYEETYTVAKRGGTEKISLEAIKNDDVGVVMRLPMKLSMAAKRTLSAHIAALFTMNSGAGPVMGDNLNLFHASHNNSGTSALSRSAVAAGRLAMIQQQELSSAKPLGIPPRTLLVPWELQETAFNLFRMGTNNDRDFVQNLMYEVCPVPDWSDEGDWALVADPMMMDTIEVGYLDDQREPEIFVQNQEHYGSMFSNDQWSFKIRHIYGAAVMDWRGLYKGIVS